jgi:hypothetical protein
LAYAQAVGKAVVPLLLRGEVFVGGDRDIDNLIATDDGLEVREHERLQLGKLQTLAAGGDVVTPLRLQLGSEFIEDVLRPGRVAG